MRGGPILLTTSTGQSRALFDDCASCDETAPGRSSAQRSGKPLPQLCGSVRGKLPFFIALAFCLAPLALPVCAALILWFCLQDTVRWAYGRPVPQWSIPHTERIA
jgi:hypothetical protein